MADKTITPVAGGYRGRTNIFDYTTATARQQGLVSPASASALVCQPVAVHLVEVSVWLAEYAFGMYRDTIMHEAQTVCDMLALCAYCSWLAPVPVAFSAPGDDLAAARLLDAVGLVSLRCVASLDFGGRPVCHDIATGAIDRRTGELAEFPLLPSLAAGSRRDAANIRRLICGSVQANHAALAANGAGPVRVLRTAAALAGGKWVRVAESALRGGGEA